MTWLLGILQSIGKWLLPVLVDKAWKALVSWWEKKETIKKDEDQAASASDEYMETVNNPNATREERKRAEDKFVNS